MRNFFLISLFLLFACSPVLAQLKVPRNVTAMEINLYETHYFDEHYNVDYKNGRFVYPELAHDGKLDGYLEGLSVDLTFWNVGELGGSSGMLFWKKAYGDATLIVDYRPEDPFHSYKKNSNLGGLEAYGIEEVSAPEADPIVYHLTFSGGPYGTFTEREPYVGTKPVTGHIEQGRYVYLNFEYSDPTEYPWPIDEQYFDLPLTYDGNAFTTWMNWDYGCGSGDSGARFSDFSGEVTVLSCSDLEDEHPAEMDMVLDQGSHVITGSDSSAIIGFADMTTFVLRPFTRVVLDHAPEKQGTISLLSGKIWANVKRMIKDGSMDVTMNQAVAGIKGTTFIASDDGMTSTLQVIEGEVEFTSKATGEMVMVGSGQQASATENGLSEVTAFDTVAAETEWATVVADAKEHRPAPQQPSTQSSPSKSSNISIVRNLLLGIAAFLILAFVGKILLGRRAKKD